jgi:hypothetical protein
MDQKPHRAAHVVASRKIKMRAAAVRVIDPHAAKAPAVQIAVPPTTAEAQAMRVVRHAEREKPPLHRTAINAQKNQNAHRASPFRKQSLLIGQDRIGQCARHTDHQAASAVHILANDPENVRTIVREKVTKNARANTAALRRDNPNRILN